MPVGHLASAGVAYMAPALRPGCWCAARPHASPVPACCAAAASPGARLAFSPCTHPHTSRWCPDQCRSQCPASPALVGRARAGAQRVKRAAAASGRCRPPGGLPHGWREAGVRPTCGPAGACLPKGHAAGLPSIARLPSTQPGCPTCLASSFLASLAAAATANSASAAGRWRPGARSVLRRQWQTQEGELLAGRRTQARQRRARKEPARRSTPSDAAAAAAARPRRRAPGSGRRHGSITDRGAEAAGGVPSPGARVCRRRGRRPAAPPLQPLRHASACVQGRSGLTEGQRPDEPHGRCSSFQVAAARPWRCV